MSDTLFQTLKGHWPITAQGYVNPWECDDMGHMNVQFYFQHLHAARIHLANMLDLDIRDLFVPRVTVNFIDELPASSSLQINSALVERDAVGLWVAHILSDPLSDGPSTTFYELWIDVPGGKTEALSAEARAFFGADRTFFDLPNVPLSVVTDKGATVGTRSVVRPSECDERGHLLQQYHINRLSDGAGFQWKQVAGENMRDMVANRRGGAVVSYHLKFFRWARAGDPLETRLTALKVGGSSFTLGNFIYNSKSGDAIACAETVLVHFDLEARKAIPLTDVMREQMTKNLIEF